MVKCRFPRLDLWFGMKCCQILLKIAKVWNRSRIGIQRVSAGYVELTLEAWDLYKSPVC